MNGSAFGFGFGFGIVQVQVPSYVQRFGLFPSFRMMKVCDEYVCLSVCGVGADVLTRLLLPLALWSAAALNTTGLGTLHVMAWDPFFIVRLCVGAGGGGWDVGVGEDGVDLLALGGAGLAG